MTYAVFDIGAIVYWLAPTAPPWWAAGRPSATPAGDPEVRRMMVEYGEHFWGDGWGSLTVSWEATLSPRCPLCTSPHP